MAFVRGSRGTAAKPYPECVVPPWVHMAECTPPPDNSVIIRRATLRPISRKDATFPSALGLRK